MAKKTATKARRRAAEERVDRESRRVDAETALEQGNSPHGNDNLDLPADRDQRRDATREINSRTKYPEGEELQKQRESLDEPKAGRRGSAAPRGEPAKKVDDIVPAAQPSGITSVMDHAALNHPREEHLHWPGEAGAAIEGPTPRDPRLVEDMGQLLEQIRYETKADNLYFMRRKERASQEPREHVIDAINARLREVQGEPILDE